jgi:hypothetical protein
MYYFTHSCNLESFENILKTGDILASKYLDPKYIRMTEFNYVFTNIYVDGLPLRADETAGLGRVTFIIDPDIIKYFKCYFNRGWHGGVNSNTIVMNCKNDYKIVRYLQKHYSYPYIMSHEALFKVGIPLELVMGVICNKEDEEIVEKIMINNGYQWPIFYKFPKLIRQLVEEN